MKKCSKCKEIKKVFEFYKDKRTLDGLKSQCKKCHSKTSVETRDIDKKREANKQYMRKAIKNNPEKYQKSWRDYNRDYDEKTYARMMLNSALKSGKITKPCFCQDCGKNTKLSAHHSNYDEPLQVEWLCYECHGKRHRKIF